MQEGETFELTFENDHDRPHTVHVHAVGKSWKDDGAPVSTRTKVDAGDSKTYVLEGDVPGRTSITATTRRTTTST